MEAELDNCENASVVTQLWLEGSLDNPDQEDRDRDFDDIGLCGCYYEDEGCDCYDEVYGLIDFDPEIEEESRAYWENMELREPAPLKPRAERRRDNARIVSTRGAMFHRFTPDKRPRPAGQYRKYNGGPDFMPPCYRYNRYQAMRRNDLEIGLGFDEMADVAEELRLEAEEREAMEKHLLDAYEAGFCDSLEGGIDDSLRLVHDDPDYDEMDGFMDDSDDRPETLHQRMSRELMESIVADEERLNEDFERDLVMNVGSNETCIDDDLPAVLATSMPARSPKSPDAEVRRIEENLRLADELDAVGREYDRIFGIQSIEKDRFEN